MRRALLIGSLLGSAVPALAGDPELIVSLHVYAARSPTDVPEAAPPRVLLFDDGQLYLGGTSHVASTRLERDDYKDIEKEASRVRKLSGLGSAVTLGSGTTRYRLVLGKGRPLEILATGDPGRAAPALRPLGELLEHLLGLDPPDLKPYRPAFYALRVRPAQVTGGCRAWTFMLPLADCLGSARSVPASALLGWPSGAAAASVCQGDKAFLVSLRPLLPGEKP